MKRKRLWLLALAMLALAAGGCAPQTVNPLAKNEATAVPGLNMALHAASANDQNVDTATVTLYFRYLDEPMLAAETRTLSLRRDQSLEYAIVLALVEGPSAGHSEMRGLIPADTRVESVVSRGNILFVTFNEGFLEDDVPDNWAEDEEWKQAAPTLRALIAQSIAASVTEQFAYTGVQILVHKADEVQTNLRLDNAYFLNGSTGPSNPIQRNEALFLTPQRTGEILLTAWQQHDAQRLYRYISGTDIPSLADWTETLANAPSLTAYTLGGGSISEDGQTATLTVRLNTLAQDAQTQTDAYPLQLTREYGIWKIRYARLTALLER